MLRFASFLMLVGVLGIVAGSAQAALITNGSFENPDVADGGYNTAAFPVDGWTVSTNGKATGYTTGIMDPSTNPTGILGDQIARMAFPVAATINQWLKLNAPSQGNVLAGYTYTLDVAVGLLTGETQPVYAASGYNEVTLKLSGQSFVIRYPTFTAGTLTELSIGVVVGSDGTLVSSTSSGGASFSAPAVGTLLTGGVVDIQLMGGRISSDSGTGKNFTKYLNFDNVRLSAIPEPAAMSLLGLGAVGLLARRRRR